MIRSRIIKVVVALGLALGIAYFTGIILRAIPSSFFSVVPYSLYRWLFRVPVIVGFVFFVLLLILFFKHRRKLEPVGKAGERRNTMASEEKANTFKFSTIVYLVLGLILPLWPITLPLFWFLAYRSYKRGS